MGFSIFYESTKPVPRATAEQIRQATDELCQGYTWLSCEPVSFFGATIQGKFCDASKPNFFPHPDDVASAAKEGLPDGTVTTLLDILVNCLATIVSIGGFPTNWIHAPWDSSVAVSAVPV